MLYAVQMLHDAADWGGGSHVEPELVELKATHAVRTNASGLYAHVFCQGPARVFYRNHPLITYRPPPREKKTKNLLDTVCADPAGGKRLVLFVVMHCVCTRRRSPRSLCWSRRTTRGCTCRTGTPT
jgi:hypothetical protein